jgi:O-antigen/teichoic acid export membrane protein
MGLVAGLSTLIYSIPRLTVDAFAGKEATGYYSAIASLLALGNLFFAGLGQAASPRLAVYFQTNRRAFVLLAAKLAGVAVLLGLVGTGVSALIGEWLLRVLFTEDYAQYSDFFVLIMVVATLNFLFTCMQTAFSATRRFGLQLPIYLVAVGVLLLTSLQFVPEHGIYGAAWALMICNSVGAIGCIAGIAAVLRFTEPQTGNRRAG